MELDGEEEGKTEHYYRHQDNEGGDKTIHDTERSSASLLTYKCIHYHYLQFSLTYKDKLIITTVDEWSCAQSQGGGVKLVAESLSQLENLSKSWYMTSVLFSSEIIEGDVHWPLVDDISKQEVMNIARQLKNG